MQNNNQASADESNSGKRASFTKRIAAMSSREPSAAEPSFSGSSGLLTPSSHRRNKSDDYKNLDRQSSSALINNSEQTFPKFEGQLYKWTNYVKGWRKRYFVLENAVLMYFMSERSLNSRGSINLLTAVICVTKKHKTRLEIDTGEGVFHLRAKTKEDRNRWVDALTKSKEMLSQLSRTEENINKHIKSLGSPVDTLKKTLSLTQSFAGVLKKELDLLERKKEDKDNKDKDKDKHKKKKKEGDEKADFVSQASQFHQNALKLISAVESALLAVNKFDEERTAIQRDYEAFARQQTQLKETVRILKAENAILKRKLALSGTHGDDVSDGEASVEEGVPTMKVPLTPTVSNTVSPAIPRANEEREEISNIITGTHTIDSDSDDESDDSTMYFDPEEAEQQGDRSDDSDHAVSKPRSITNSKKANAGDDLQLVSSPSRRLLMLSQSAKNTAPPEPTLNNLEETFKSVPATWKRRAELPADKDPKAKISLVKILKDAIGKDISKITLPVQLCEPLSLLQRLVEDFEYCDLLNQAATIADPMLRMVYVGCFAVSGYSSTYDRLSKQFNSILGETYELVREDKGFRIFTEQVSHHPPISAAVAEGREWHFWGHAHVKNKFWGKSLEIYPSGVLSLAFPKYGDHFVWSRCTTCVHNVLVGNKWIEHYGEIEIMNNGKNERVVMELKKKGWFSSGGNEVFGTVYDANNKVRYRIEGKWTESLSAYPVDDAGQAIKEKGFLVWKMNPLPPKSAQQFKFTSFSMGLNEMPDWLVPILPRSDSRFRTDQRALENGDVDLAGTEKTRLEEKQRAARKKREQEGIEHKPRWFDKSADGVWTYKGGYWETRLKGEWTDIPDLY